MTDTTGARPPISFDELMERALRMGREHGKARLGVAAAWDPVALEAVHDAWKLDLVEPVLIGDRGPIEKAAGEAGADISSWPLVEADGDVASAKKAVELVRSGDVDFLMKGKVNTADIMRAALDKETGIRAGKLMSHIAVMWTPTFGRLLCMSDGGIVPGPAALSPSAGDKALPAGGSPVLALPAGSATPAAIAQPAAAAGAAAEDVPAAVEVA